ncbi:AAA family ATPase [Acinetobacter sp. 228]|jgi:putative ATP-dependent endonuclease of OLD family|uniref:AAA family ATPase n=1 Tax=Acinetobacter sp. 228 TaxID=3114700 RepID=UPI00241DB8DE|nr:AAA family ATPase [Acinetobacter lwoffii]
MKLIALKLENFRGYQGENLIYIDSDLTGIIGKNDAGKSTILEALDIFFENSSLDKSDKCVNCTEEDNISITCIFDDIPTSLTLDATSVTTLQEEYLLNSEGYLEIKKTFRVNQKVSTDLCLLAKYPDNNGLDNLIILKNADLKALFKTKGLDISQVQDQRSNTSLRQYLFQSEPLTFRLKEVPLNKEDAKNVWDALKNFLPIYALFKSDRNSSDQDSEVQDPMKLAIKHALSEIQPQLQKIQEHIKTKVEDVAGRTLEKLAEMDPNLAQDLIPDFSKEPKWESIFSMALSSEQGIPINKRGSGVRRLILLNFFRAEAEKKFREANGRSIIYAIEEPETSQHPDYQEMLIKALLDLSILPKTQILVTTHTPALAGLMPISSLRYITKDEKNQHVIAHADCNHILKSISSDLGIHPFGDISNLQCRGYIFVEGVSDVVFLKHIFTKFAENGLIQKDYIAELDVQLLISGGSDNLKHWVNYKLIESLQKPWAVFFDSDNDGQKCPKYQQNLAIKAKYPNIIFHLTNKRECENYLHPNLILRVTKNEVNHSPDDFSDQKVILQPLLLPYKSVKQTNIIEKLWDLTTCDEIIQSCTDQQGNNEFLKFINQIEERFGLVELEKKTA